MGIIISIVGKPNTGKSTLFNALTQTSKSLTDDLPGVTRDTVIGEVIDDDFSFVLCDTAGFESGKHDGDSIEDKINRQVDIAVESSDGIIFLTDRKTGYMPDDADIFNRLRKKGKKLYFCVNKIDDDKHEAQASEFYETGAEDLWYVSAAHKRGFSDLLSKIKSDFAQNPTKPDEPTADLSVAVIGRPNTGKSTLVNRLLGYNKQITHDMSGTTRNSVDSYFAFHGKTVRIIDTAGIRRKNRIDDRLEKLSVLSAIRSIDQADIVWLILDAMDFGLGQDLKLAAYVKKSGKPMIITVNKWDVPDKDSMTAGKVREEIKARMPFVSYCPVMFISGLTGTRTAEMVARSFELVEKCRIRLPVNKLIDVVKNASSEHRMNLSRGRHDRIYFASQVRENPPTFLMWVKYPKMVSGSYKNYIENTLRKKFDLEAVPVKIFWKAKL